MLYKNSDKSRMRAEEEELKMGRSPFRRDFGRLLHSPSFRRLQGKTQLFPGHESDFFRNRLTHSLEVAQIAKGIGQMLNEKSPFNTDQLDLDLIEFAGLAHDLGHPPFGHNGECALDDCMKQWGGFEGNAQTLRILARVEKKIVDGDVGSDHLGISENGTDRRLGLNLTFRSLASILKYDREIPVKRKCTDKLVKGYYSSEKQVVDEIKRQVGDGSPLPFKTVECQIMDIADDIAYSTYDLEDAMKGGFTHPLQLLVRVRTSAELVGQLKDKISRDVSDVEEGEIYDSLDRLLRVDELGSDPFEVYRISKLIANDGRMRCKFTSEMVGEFMRGISVSSLPNKDIKFVSIEVDRATKLMVETLKHLNYLLTIMSPRLKVVEYRGYDVVETIFRALDARDGHLLMPDDVQSIFVRARGDQEKKRIICDFVAGMTDRYAMEFYSRLRSSGASIFKPI